MLPYELVLFADDTIFILTDKINTNLSFSFDDVSKEQTQNIQISVNNQICSNCGIKNVKLLGITLENKFF